MTGFRSKDNTSKINNETSEKKAISSSNSKSSYQEFTNVTNQSVIPKESKIASKNDSDLVKGGMAILETMARNNNDKEQKKPSNKNLRRPTKGDIEQNSNPEVTTKTIDGTNTSLASVHTLGFRSGIGRKVSKQEAKAGKEVYEEAKIVYANIISKDQSARSAEEKKFLELYYKNEALIQTAERKSKRVLSPFRRGLQIEQQSEFQKVRNELSRITGTLQEDLPSKIAERTVRPISAKNLNCFLRAVPWGANPLLPKSEIENTATQLRQEAEAELGRVEDDQMLNPGEPKGRAVLLMMHDKGLINLNRGFVVYNKTSSTTDMTVIVHNSNDDYSDAHAVFRNGPHFSTVDNIRPLEKLEKYGEDSQYVKELRARTDEYKIAKQTNDILNELLLHTPNDSDKAFLIKKGVLPEDFSKQLQDAQQDVHTFMNATTQDELYQIVQYYKNFYEPLRNQFC